MPHAAEKDAGHSGCRDMIDTLHRGFFLSPFLHEFHPKLFEDVIAVLQASAAWVTGAWRCAAYQVGEKIDELPAQANFLCKILWVASASKRDKNAIVAFNTELLCYKTVTRQC